MKRYAFIAFLCTIFLSLTLTGGALPYNVVTTSATLNTTYKYKIVNENSGLVLGINSPQLTAGSNALQWSDNGSADHLWH
jgi:hypothetical protein